MRERERDLANPFLAHGFNLVKAFGELGTFGLGLSIVDFKVFELVKTLLFLRLFLFLFLFLFISLFSRLSPPSSFPSSNCLRSSSPLTTATVISGQLLYRRLDIQGLFWGEIPFTYHNVI